MDFKSVSELSFFSDDQKLLFARYTIFENGSVFNEHTQKFVSKTLHGIRGFVTNLSIRKDGVRVQRQIVIHKAVADLFLGPIKDGEKLFFKDGNKLNIDVSNLVYRMTKTQQGAEYSKCLSEMKGITEDGRICNVCEEFKAWDLIAGPDDKKLSVCKQCVSKRGMEYQKSVDYPNGRVLFDTYANRMHKDDEVVNVGGYLSAICSKCKNAFILTRSKVLNRIKSVSKKCNVLPLVCEKCAKGEDNESN